MMSSHKEFSIEFSAMQDTVPSGHDGFTMTILVYALEILLEYDEDFETARPVVRFFS